MTPARSRHGGRAVGPAGVTLLVAFALVLRLYGLGHEDFWIDEIFQVRVSAQPLRDIVAHYVPGTRPGTFTRDQAPLSHLLFHFFVREGGGEALARLPSAVSGALSAGVVLVLAARLLPFGVAALGAFILTLAPLDLWYSQECRFYALWKLEASVSYLALLRALEEGRLCWWAAYCLSTIAGTYTCIMHGLVILAQSITVAWHGRRAGRTRVVFAFGLALLIAAAATLPVTGVIVAEIDRPAGTLRPVVVSALPYTFFAYAAGFSFGPTVSALHSLPSPFWVLRHYPSVALVFAVFVPVTLAGLRGLGARSRAASFILPWLVVPPIGVLLLSAVSNISYNARYAFTSLVPFLLLVATGCLSFRAKRLRWAAVTAVLACTLAALGSFYWNETYDKEQVRAALAYVRATDPGRPRMVVVGQVSRAFDYYARGSRTTLMPSCADAGAADAHGGEAAQPGTLWVAAGRDWDGGAATCLRLLSERYRQVDQRRFVGIELWRLELRGAPVACRRPRGALSAGSG